MKKWVKIVIGVVVAVVVVGVAAPFIYIHFIKADAPTAFSIDEAPVASTGSTGTTDSSITNATTAAPVASGGSTSTTGADGTYTLTSDSQVGYRVVEVLFGQDTEGVGRTNSVTGSLTIAGTQVTDATFTVQMNTLVSDESRRDNVFKGEVMETSKYPTATFTITQPIELGTIPPDGTEVTASATGNLTLHGVTKPVTLDVTAKKTGDSIAIQGSTDIVFADYNIENPSRAGITTQDHGKLEFLLVANKS